MKKQKEVSTLTGVIIIIVASVIIFAGVVVYQYSATQRMLSLFVQSFSLASLLKR